ncbi:hypothetical protein LTR78_003798 [Recurvomyces mirabilis]|uniref:Myb-like DNA-binding domain-containing protein n=1 Tax=Recurvomyces mirabilis TaxID=574656 RepID=A0AAE0WRH2_9PEZI|nr:hypothetical protein LTR78_003798 [Recurvomyces mirabilis]KAK5154910.1 hypothetical protein LTS14_006491 [Recurvomyces mirabilis]
MASEDTSVKGFTDGETKLLMCMIKHLQGDIPTDYDAVAAEMGYKDASIAKTRWGQIKRKKINTTGDNPTPKKRKGATTDGDDAENGAPNPKKRGRKPKTTKPDHDGLPVKDEVVEEAEAVESTEKGGDGEFT